MESSKVLKAVPTPFFEPKGAIGWEMGPLDGLSCYLRCVESILRARGFDLRTVAQALLQDLDLLRRSSTSSEFQGCKVEWLVRENGEQNWDLICENLQKGDPLLLMPDLFYWPGHAFENKRHFYDHMVLITELSDWGTPLARLHFLDTDGPEKEGFRRSFFITENLKKSFTRLGRVSVQDPLPTLTADRVLNERVKPNLSKLNEDIADLRELAEFWERDALPEDLARAFHIIVLGDMQPQLRILSVAITQNQQQQEFTLRISDCARKAVFLGWALLAEHGKISTPDTYPLSKLRLRALISALESFSKQIEPQSHCPARKPFQKTHLYKRITQLSLYCGSN